MDLKLLKSKTESLEAFRKARTHKYYKRVKGKSGKWIYYYTKADYEKGKDGKPIEKKTKLNQEETEKIKALNIAKEYIKNGGKASYNASYTDSKEAIKNVEDAIKEGEKLSITKHEKSIDPDFGMEVPAFIVFMDEKTRDTYSFHNASIKEKEK